MDNFFNLGKLNETMAALRPITTAENFTEVIEEQINNLQEALKPDQELIVFCDAAGNERVRALQFSFPRRDIALIAGVDSEGNETHIISHTDSLQLTCKIKKLEPNTQRARIGFSFAAEG